MLEPQDKIRFEKVMLPHLNTAANLARWLLRNRDDWAELRSIDSLRKLLQEGGVFEYASPKFVRQISRQLAHQADTGRMKFSGSPRWFVISGSRQGDDLAVEDLDAEELGIRSGETL